MTNNQLVWIVAAAGAFLSLLVQFIARILFGSKDPSELATIPLIPNVLHFTYLDITNSFAISANNRSVLILGSIIFILCLSFIILLVSKLLSRSGKKIAKSLQIGLGLLLAGSISNTVERILAGGVVQFIDFQLWRMPVFNLADLFVYIGI
ncbi:MAG: signal peptidase II [Thainema sp.]